MRLESAVIEKLLGKASERLFVSWHTSVQPANGNDFPPGRHQCEIEMICQIYFKVTKN